MSEIGAAPQQVETVETPSRARPTNLIFALLLMALLLVMFEFMRLGMILRTHNSMAATNTELFWSFIIGARFDLAVAAMLAIPVMPLLYLPRVGPSQGRRVRGIWLWVLTVVYAFLALTCMAEFEFFQEFQSRFNQLAIRYWEQPKTVGGMIWYNYPVVRYLLVWLVIAAILHLALRGALRLAFGKTAEPVRLTRRIAAVESIGAVVLVLIIVICARGGIGPQPLKWGNAFTQESEYANQMSLNGLWTLGVAAKDMVGRNSASRGWTKAMDEAEARSIVRELVVAPGEELLDPQNRTVLRQGDPGSWLRLAGKDGKPVNVVLVLMESMSARFVGATGAAESFTPNLDAVAKDGILFDHCMSAGSHTHQGIFATSLGFPNLPGFDALMQSTAANQEFLSIPEIFSARGYQTVMLYNGNLAWDNMYGFFRKQGIQKFISGEDIKDAMYRDPVWGVSDGDLFEHANREFEESAKKGPFFGFVITLSNHAPFDVPPVPGAQPITHMGEYNRRLEAMRYADYAIGKFIEEAKTKEYYKNTLFVFVGDHGFHVPPVLTEVHLLYHHVPLIFYSPSLMPADARGKVDHRLAVQMDILPSILGLLGIKDSPHASWGRSLFNDAFKNDFAVFKMSGGLTATAIAENDKLLVLGSASGKPLLMNYDLMKATVSPYEGPDSAAVLATLQRKLRAYVQSALNDLQTSRAGPMRSPQAK